MTPTVRFRPDRLLEVLTDHDVRFVVIGGFAAALHGSPYPTGDLDVTPATDRENLGRLAAALRDLQARLRVEGLADPVAWPLDERSFDQGTTWPFVTSAGYLDICLRPDGTGGYPDLISSATVEPITERLTVAVAALADVIRSKQAAGRDRDLRVLPALRLLQEQSGG